MHALVKPGIARGDSWGAFHIEHDPDRMSTSEDIPRQSGVIPYRCTPRGVEVLLITSNTRKRWIIPKGNIGEDLDERESARREAYEEAGIRGKIRRISFGSYQHYSSGGPSLVVVFLMEVDEVLESWPEGAERVREWMPPHEAHDRVLEQGLKKLLLEVEELLL